AYVNGVTGFFCLCHKDLHAFAKVGRGSQKNSFGFRDLGFKARKRRSWPISRVLSGAIIPLGAASPRPSSSLPGRSAGPTLAPHPCGCAPTSLFGLAPGGVCRAVECCHRRGALLPHPFTLTSALRHFGGLLSVALSVGSRPPGVTWHLVHWSPDFPPRTEKVRGDCLASSRRYLSSDRRRALARAAQRRRQCLLPSRRGPSMNNRRKMVIAAGAIAVALPLLAAE